MFEPLQGTSSPILPIYDEANTNPLGRGRKLNAHKTFRRRPGRLLNVLCTFNLRRVQGERNP